MSFLTPDSGLLFWMLISFGIVVFILAKFGFPVILKMVDERKMYIDESLSMAEKARTELQSLKADGDLIIDNARKEHAKIVLEANQLKDLIVNEARLKALDEANKIIDNARLQIEAEKNSALREIRNQIASLSVDVAEKVIRTKLDRKEDHSTMINRLLDEMKISKS